MLTLRACLAWCVLLGQHPAIAVDTYAPTEVRSFSVPKSPSGMFFYEAQNLLYILCGTNTNGDHYLYAFTTEGTQKCFITIPESAKMSRVDGFYIVGSTAYIVDSQGPIYASSHQGGSLYAVTWTNPCSCDASGSCSSSEATWTPTITKTHTLSATDTSIGDGGGTDEYFRNSGVVVSGDYFYAVNGVHPHGKSLTCCYPKSLVKASLSDTSIAAKWSFTASTLGHDVDMEGLTCGADGCSNYLYIGDEYNLIYRLTLSTSDAASAVESEWNLNDIVGDVQADKGIESLAFEPATGYFYAGIQGTSKVHVVQLTNTTSTYVAGAWRQGGSSVCAVCSAISWLLVWLRV